MYKYRFGVSCLLLAAAAVLCATPSGAQTVCGDRAKLIDVLAQKFDEMPSAFGIAGESSLVELFVSKTGSWTMLLTRPGGTSCIMATGQSWDQYPATAKMTGL